MTIFWVTVSVSSQPTTITLQEIRSGASGGTIVYNVEDIAFNWTDGSRADEASFWFQDCPG